MNGGTYCLVLRLDESRTIQVGKLGRGFFPAGYYVYVGSALRGLQKRLARHLSSQKKKHWHIDYLLECARNIDTREVLSLEKRECSFSQKVRNISQGIPMKGFGSSDCRCNTHLYFFPNNPMSNPLFESVWG